MAISNWTVSRSGDCAGLKSLRIRFEPGTVHHEECLKEYIAIQAGNVGLIPALHRGDRLVVRTPYISLSNSCLRDLSECSAVW